MAKKITSKDKDEYRHINETAEYVKGLDLPEGAALGIYSLLMEMGKSDLAGMESQIVRLIQHLLKFTYQPEKATPSWKSSILDARVEIDLALRRSPSLKSKLSQTIADPFIYNRAKRKAEGETSKKMPKANPFSEKEILSNKFFGHKK